MHDLTFGGDLVVMWCFSPVTDDLQLPNHLAHSEETKYLGCYDTGGRQFLSIDVPNPREYVLGF